ncbi:DNA methyltransferase, partial [Lacticaseibacillus paracasei]|uniref:DNA methyltransferase n=1 Tax=Lacticaseibacillus paracasei TaxID=1597 RepID=UPI000A3F4A69
QETDIYQNKADYIKRGYMPIRPPKVRNELGAWTWAISKFNDNKDSIKIIKTRNGYSVRKIQRVKRNEVKKDLNGNYYIETVVLSNARSIIRFATTQGVSRINQLFERQGLFNNPKSDDLIKYLIKLVLAKGITVLDFFAGSSTTADAVMQLNAEDGGHRKFIMAQLPEKTYHTNKDDKEVPTKGGKAAYEDGFKSIDQISRERIRRAAKKIRKDNELTLPKDFDGSFKHYRVVKPVRQTLEDIEDFDPNNTNFFTNVVDGFSSQSLEIAGDSTGEDTILTTWLAKDGYSFDANVEEIKFGNYAAHQVENNRLYLINEGWGADQTKELLNQLGTHQLEVQSVVLFGYSFNVAELRELENGLKQLDSKVTLIKRY